MQPSTTPLSSHNHCAKELAALDVNGDGRFDLSDLQAFHDAYVEAGSVLEPSAPDYGRFDLNGDGFTGGRRTAPMDLDPTGSAPLGAPVLSEVFAEVGAAERTFNETAVTDAMALCYYANTALYTGAPNARDTLLRDLCGKVTVTVQPAHI